MVLSIHVLVRVLRGVARRRFAVVVVVLMKVVVAMRVRVSGNVRVHVRVGGRGTREAGWPRVKVEGAAPAAPPAKRQRTAAAPAWAML